MGSPLSINGLDHGHRIFARRGRVSRPVGEKDAIRLVGEDGLGVDRGGHDGHVTAGGGERAQDVALGTIIDRDHAVARRGAGAVGAGFDIPGGLGPAVGLAAADILGEVHAFQPRPGPGLGGERGLVDGRGLDVWISAPSCAPPVRNRRVSRLVSIPAMPMRPRRSSQPSRCWTARQFEGSVTSARSTSPSAAGVPDSRSSSLVPTLPIWGK